MARMRSMSNNTALLDITRGQYGNDQTRHEFYNQYTQNPDSALEMLNDPMLQFPSLYLLRPEIKKLDLEGKLSQRNRMALEISTAFISDDKEDQFKYKPEQKPVLQWMFKTGYKEMDLGDEYDEIMDFTAILLVREIHDKSCLHPLEELIFMRHRKGAYTYDAEWALFESKDPECIALIAKRLLSSDRRDVDYAKKMLKFIPCFDASTNEPLKLYNCIMQWLNENRPYLRYTGENNQKDAMPRPYEITLEAKYLQMPYAGSADINRMPYSDLTRLNKFLELDFQTKVMLSDFSNLLHTTNKHQWYRWMAGSLKSQIETAAGVLERNAAR